MSITGYLIRMTSIINYLGSLVLSNLDKIVFSAIAVIIGFGIYKLIKREIEKLMIKKRMEEHIAYTLIKIVKWLMGLIILSAILTQFGVTIGSIAGLLTIFGGTIIGFASINTIGNAIAGLIIMTSRPFKVGDRIYFNEKFADVWVLN